LVDRRSAATEHQIHHGSPGYVGLNDTNHVLALCKGGIIAVLNDNPSWTVSELANWKADERHKLYENKAFAQVHLGRAPRVAVVDGRRLNLSLWHIAFHILDANPFADKDKEAERFNEARELFGWAEIEDVLQFLGEHVGRMQQAVDFVLGRMK
jgi:hypothetical protein